MFLYTVYDTNNDCLFTSVYYIECNSFAFEYHYKNDCTVEIFRENTDGLKEKIFTYEV